MFLHLQECCHRFHRQYHEYTTPRASTSRSYPYTIYSPTIPHNHSCSCYLFHYTGKVPLITCLIRRT
jgi:hypothetical protein